LVADAWNERIQQLDPNGAPRGSIPITGWESRSILDKPYLAADARGRIYVTAPERYEILVVDVDGQVRPLSLPGGRGRRPATPTGIDVGAGGELYVAESSGGVLRRYSVLDPP